MSAEAEIKRVHEEADFRIAEFARRSPPPVPATPTPAASSKGGFAPSADSRLERRDGKRIAEHRACNANTRRHVTTMRSVSTATWHGVRAANPRLASQEKPDTSQHASSEQRSIAAAFQHCVRPRVDRSGILRPGIRPRRRWKQCWKAMHGLKKRRCIG